MLEAHYGVPHPNAERVRLPAVGLPASTPVADAIARRRSLRDYDERPITTSELGWILRYLRRGS
jgi:hypothetical protein